MSILDIIIFLFFTGGVVVFGCSFFNKKRSSEEFTSAGRSLPGWVVGMSIFATYVSSISYLAYPGKAYMSDWNFIVLSEAYRLTVFWKNALAPGHVYMRHRVIF